MEKSKETLIQVINMLPETQKKVDYYKESLQARADLHKILIEKVESGKLTDEEKARIQIEIVDLADAIYYQQQVFEKYIKRLKEYEDYMEEIYTEVNNNFDAVMDEAKSIPSNPRLMTALAKWKKDCEHNTFTQQDKAEFYLLLKSEISNSKRLKKR
jgi:hypothetical protein